MISLACDYQKSNSFKHCMVGNRDRNSSFSSPLEPLPKAECLNWSIKIVENKKAIIIRRKKTHGALKSRGEISEQCSQPTLCFPWATFLSSTFLPNNVRSSAVRSDWLLHKCNCKLKSLHSSRWAWHKENLNATFKRGWDLDMVKARLAV